MPERDFIRQRITEPGNVRVLLDLYGVTGLERDGLIQLARDARREPLSNPGVSRDPDR